MMAHRSIKRLTAAQRDDLDHMQAERYDELAEEIEAHDRNEYESEFGEAFLLKHPYKKDPQKIHDLALKRMAQDAEN